MDINKKIGFIIQARTGSARFPHKTVREFYKGKSILEILINRIKKIKDIPIIIATTKNPGDEIIVRIAKNMEVNHYIGSENNVLKRFIEAAQIFHLDYIIRICADNIFLDLDSLNDIILKIKNYPVDYLSYILSGNRPSIKTHFGFWAEIVSLKALLKIADATAEDRHIEHVTSYIYEHPGDFEISFIKAQEIVYNREDIRLTIDTEEDFILQQSIYHNLNFEKKAGSIEEIIDYIDSDQTILEKMKYQIYINRK